jgi:hypothetical protein
LLPFLEAAKRQGDDVVVVAPPALREMVVGAGYRFAPGGEPSEAEVAVIREQLPLLPASDASVLGNRELFGRLATEAMLPCMRRIFEGWGPDVVMREPSEYASAVLAHDMGTQVVQVAISFADVEAGSIAIAASALEEHHPGLTEVLMTTPYLTRFPGSLDPSRFPATVRYREMSTRAPEPLPSCWGGLGGPLIYVSFGTVLGYMSDAADVYGTALKAVEHLDARVLLSVGRKFDASVLGPLPRHVHIEAWVDQHRVLQDAQLVVTHCGSGTALGSLAAGVPIVAVPLFADQFENSRRLADAGAALIVKGRRNRDAEPRALLSDEVVPNLTAAIDAVLRDGDFRRHAGLIAAEMAAMPSPDEVLRQVSVLR